VFVTKHGLINHDAQVHDAELAGVERECPVCGEMFEMDAGQDKKCCSKTCWGEYRKNENVPEAWDKKYRNKKWLYRQYWGERKSSVCIANELDCTSGVISRWLKRHDIPVRGSNWTPPHLSDEKWLECKYKEKRWSMEKIANHIDCSRGAVKNALKNSDIEIRTPGESNSNWEEPYTDKEWLVERYCNQKMTTTEIGDEVGYSSNTILRWLKKYNIEIRKDNFWLPSGKDHPWYDVKGEDHPAWVNGSRKNSFYQRKQWKETRQKVLERDKHTCQDCGESDGDLQVHHIHPLSEGGAEYDTDNLITLCISCHRKWEGTYLRPDNRE